MPKQYKYTKSFSFDGKRYYVRGNTLEEVYTKKADKLRDLEQGRITVNKSMTVAEWTEICFSVYKPNVSDTEKTNMLYRINKHILSVIGTMPINKVTPIQCQKILSSQADMSKSHVTKLSQELHFIFECARKNHLILENPADDLSVPKGTEGKRRPITDDERKHFLIVAEQYKPFLLYKLMLYCGCRPTEAAHCLGSDISVINDTPMLHIRGTKTANSDRFVPIPEYFYPEIKTTAPDAPIAPNNDGHIHTESSYKRLLARLRREMNISMGCKVYRNRLVPPYPLAEDFVPYDLRHTYCTDLCKMGVDVRIAQKLMGHSSIKITADIYTHVDMESLTSIASLINRGVQQGATPGATP
jgi:integrase